MKLKNSFFYTLRENVKDEDSTSGNLLVRAGMIKKSSTGVYMYMPLGYKVLKNIENIIRDEMNKSGAQELLMPSLIPEEVYISSGRRAGFSNSMFTLKDRFNKSFALGPTHEELFTVAASMQIRSYKDMPFNIYQFQNKFRDEPRPRFGLIRVREFIMKDAYSFDTDLDGLNISYQKMVQAYKNSFDRMQMDYKIVQADTGVMGGLLSEEFQAVTDIGEDVLVLCDHCNYASNLEIAQCKEESCSTQEQVKEKQLISTPHAKTIEEVASFFNKNPEQFVKTLIYRIDDQIVACLVRGDHEVNETKVRKLFDATFIELATPETVVQVSNAKVGFAGPIGLNIPIIMDNVIKNMVNFIVGANQTDYHYTDVNLNDFTPSQVADIREIKEGDLCPVCGGNIYFKKGIEIGNTFKLGTKYSEKLNLMYSDASNQLKPVEMGSYGIGPGRCLAAITEQMHDDAGLIFPIAIAPYKVAIVLISDKDEAQLSYANQLYDELTDLGVETLLDDRDERPGVKFKDIDLIGIPLRITVGKKLNEGFVEMKLRKAGENELVSLDEVKNKIITTLK